jgi:formylglycine-generating enzyme required for sulfatase activity
MGSESGRDDEAPPHLVELSPFAICRYAVTNEEYSFFLKESGAEPPPTWGDALFGHPQQPVVCVNWFEAITYCEWLSHRLDARFRLPSEAEREMACRAGTKSAYPWGDELSRNPGDHGSRCAGAPEVVGGPPNAFGLYNMADNVHEWCMDWYDRDYYKESPTKDPLGPASGARRASRGGSWRHQVKVTRSAARSSLGPAYRYTDYGFRVACTL